DGEADKAAYIDLVELTPDDEKALRAWLADDGRGKVLHDAKGQLHALSGAGLPLSGMTCDTALAAYLVRPDQRSYDLADLVLRHLQRELGSNQDNPAQGVLGLDDGAHRGVETMQQAAAVVDLAQALQ